MCIRDRGYPVRYYHAGLSDERVELEAQLQRNALKALACTNALGMGLDKPDLRFVIHYETPASPIHYYQEIGRAGRDGIESHCILLADPDAIDTQRSMIRNSRPDRQAYLRIYTLLQTEPMRERDLLLETGLPQHTTRAILYDLQDQGLITRDTQRYYRAISRHAPSFEQYDALLQAKLAELQAIVDYWETPDCRMRYLCRFLGDEAATACGQCDTCTGETLAPPPPALRRVAEAFAFHPPLNLDTKHQKELVYAAGVALSFYGNTPVGEAIHACKYGAARQPFPDWLVEQCASLIQQRFAGDGLEGIVPIPSTVSGSLVDDFASRLAARLGVPLVPALRKVRPTQPQKDFTNAAQKAENIKGAFECAAPVQGKTLLVVDDVYDSGATLKEAGRILKQAGAGRLYAFCIARTRHRGDL